MNTNSPPTTPASPCGTRVGLPKSFNDRETGTFPPAETRQTRLAGNRPPWTDENSPGNSPRDRRGGGVLLYSARSESEVLQEATPVGDSNANTATIADWSRLLQRADRGRPYYNVV